MEKRFRWLLRHLLGPDALDEVAGAIWAFEEVRDVRDFAAAVSLRLQDARAVAGRDA